MTLTATDMTELENQNSFPVIFHHTGADELTIKTVLFIVLRMVLYKSFSAALIYILVLKSPFHFNIQIISFIGQIFDCQIMHENRLSEKIFVKSDIIK